ncbi:hypothetical protein [Jannaschia sp. W003]|uniref:hypothetical protein n=1 Tax=Jannaschia sp. W003 TaxID=2867012 RepID=UPI0021A5E252|nr:hypothetical protein [Jannaschia sp. W003]UWQ22542.1 hypothetical protein K3554_05825 [Jannaschia sp. W003]
MIRLLSLLLLLAACGTPHPLDGLDRSARVGALGHRFVVNWNADTAQATRMNPTWRPAFSGVALAAVAAVERVTGCAVPPGSVDGDVALVEMTLDCGGGGAK